LVLVLATQVRVTLEVDDGLAARLVAAGVR
jgi:hypothetical protein